MQIKPKPLVSIVTVNYNQSQVTCDLLDSLRLITYRNIEIIVVDNHSKNDNPDRIKELYPEVQLIKSSANLGFAGGNNLGIKASKGSFILFINNDIEVETDFLEPLVEAFDKYPNAGIVSPKIKFFYHDNLIQYAGYTSLNPYTIRNKLIGLNETDTGQFDEPKKTAYAHGAGMMIKRDIIDEVGLMPEVYFLYYEEIDWSEKIKAHGYDIYFIPQSVILHKESVSTGKSSPLKSYYFVRNRMIFTRRNMKGLRKHVSLLFQTLISTPKVITMHLIKGETKNALACIKGYLWNLSHPCKRHIL
jgi:GT2 family glycosyltransferase